MLDARRTFHHLDEEKRKRILEVVISEFAEKGYRGASINSMVSKIGIAKGSIYQYFGSKRDLFLYIFQKTVDLVRDHLRQVKKDTVDKDFFFRLERSLVAGVEFIRDHPEIFSLYLKVLLEDDVPFRGEIIKTIRGYAIHYFMSLLEEAAERGELREGLELERVAFVLDAVLDRYLQAYSVSHMDGDLGIYNAPMKEVEEWAKTITDIIRKGLASPLTHTG